MEEHSFPILEVSALLKDMSDLEIQVSREELIRPNLSSCLRIYSHFLLELLGISMDSLEMNFDILQELEAPNLHSESLYIMSFYRKVYKLLSDIGIQDFNFNEFLNPDKKRLLYILSGLINFSKFRQEKLQLFSSCSSKGEEYLSLKENLESKKGAILDRLNSTRQKRQDEEGDVQEIRALVLKIGTENREFKKQLSRLEGENEGLNLHERELRDKMKNTQILLNNLKQDCTRLSGKIVRNPEKLKRAIEDMHKSFKEDKGTLVISEKKSRELHSRMMIMATVEEDIKVCIEGLEAAQVEREKTRDVSRKLETEKDVLVSKKQEVCDLEMRESQAKRQLANSSEKLVRLEQHQESRKGINEKKLDQLKKDYQVAVDERAHTLKKVEENDQLSLTIEKKMLDLNKQMESELSALTLDSEELNKALDTYQSNLATAMDKTIF